MNLFKNTMLFEIGCILLAGVVLVAVRDYIFWVDDELWKQNLALINETTFQQAETVSAHFAGMEDLMRLRRNNLETVESAEKDRIEGLLRTWNDRQHHSFLVHDDRSIDDAGLGFDKIAVRNISRKKDHGIIAPHLCSNCGRRVIDFYFKINFKDGKSGCLVREMTLKSLMSRVTDNFYEGSGISYITDTHGMVLMRPSKENANRTLTSFFDILRENSNAKPDVDALASAIQGRESGHAVLRISGEPQLIAYRPIRNSDWMLVSLVPEAVIAKESSSILNKTFMLLGVVMSVILAVFGALFTGERARRHAEVKELQIAAELRASEEKNAFMASVNEEQEAQLEEIRSLNVQLQENQSQLEEASAEQEAQIDEISSLNMQLAENQARLEEAAEAARKASNAKSDFLSRMSHDIRTPMNVITGMTAIAIRHIDQRDRLEDCLNKISMESTHLLNLINDILDMSAIESGKFTLRNEEVRLGDVISNLDASVRSLVQSKAIDFIHEQDALSFPCVRSDSLRISQVCMNLLSNAVKYTPAGGTVRFRFWQEPSGGLVRLHVMVSDTGMGMSEEFIRHMYQEFSRAVDTRVNKIQGTGLGLAIVKQIVDMMHGEIEVRSEINKGTTFHVIMPVEPMDAAEGGGSGNGDGPDCGRLKGMKVLVAEDNDLNYEIAADLLAEHGMEPARAEDGSIACDILRKAAPGTYDFVLMDMQMPVMNGLEATKAIRTMDCEQTRRIPVIAMTANAYAEDARACRDAGMDAHVAKPVNPRLLVETILKVLDARKQSPHKESI